MTPCCQRYIFQFSLGLVLGLSLSMIVFFQTGVVSRYLWVVSVAEIRYQEERQITNRLNIIQQQQMDKPLNTGSDVDTELYDDTVARRLEHMFDITCVVMVPSSHLSSYATNVLSTWGHRCSNIVFARPSPFPLKKSEAIACQNFRESRKCKVFTSSAGTGGQLPRDAATRVAALEYAYNTFPQSDWFVTTDSSTYIILENLRYFLFDQAIQGPVVYGQLRRSSDPKSAIPPEENLPVLGAGVVFSRSAISKLFHGMESNQCNISSMKGYPFEKVLQECSMKVGVTLSEPRDILGGTLFHDDNIESYWRRCHPLSRMRAQCETEEANGNGLPSDFAISFHGYSSIFLETLNYHVYGLHPHGVHWQYSIEPDEN